ncbi:DUF2330 domain-containing protein [Serinibacter salmoneus]|uniref:DUF2330 domain-containing protein n=1 Tax=Serinibacter salmoneus TaxID=556530 RepID=UPI00147417BC|nr:DUF2330 domain-containing protein [Serinibacter salmoneus]
MSRHRHPARRRPIATLVASLAGALFALAPLAGPAAAEGTDATEEVEEVEVCLCGRLATVPGEEAFVVAESAVLRRVDGQQRSLVQLAVRGDASTALAIFPTPNPAEVSVGDAATMDLVAELAAPEVEEVSRWWPDPQYFSEQAEEAATPLEPQEVTTSEVMTTEKGDREALATWISDAGMAISEEAQAVVDRYADAGWSFSVVQLTVDGGFDGVLPPIELSFASDRMVQPILFDGASSRAVTIRSYVIHEQRIDRDDDLRGGAEVLFAGPISAADTPELQGWLEPYGGSGYLTLSEQAFTAPATQVTENAYFTGSTLPDISRNEVVIVDRMVLGMHAGPALVGLGLVVIAVAGVVVSRLMRH